MNRTPRSKDRSLRTLAAAFGLLAATGAGALDVNVVGLFPNKAVVQVEGGALQTLSIGQKTSDNVILLSVERDGATFDIQGRRVSLSIAPARRQSRAATPATADYASVSTDERGNFSADGAINGMQIRFAVDTGATFITLSAQQADRLRLDYLNGPKAIVKTANGDVLAYRLTLDAVRVGDLVVHDVDAVITEGNSLPVALLGMSFLTRVDMRSEGTVLTLTKRSP